MKARLGKALATRGAWHVGVIIVEFQHGSASGARRMATWQGEAVAFCRTKHSNGRSSACASYAVGLGVYARSSFDHGCERRLACR